MKLKNTVDLVGLRTETLLAIVIVNDIYKSYEVDLVLTSVIDGVHSRGSIHYTGFAFDCRTSNVPNGTLPLIVKDIQDALSPQFDVVLESDHLHIEFQPKE